MSESSYNIESHLHRHGLCNHVSLILVEDIRMNPDASPHIWVFLLHHLTHQKRVTTHFRCFITCHYDCHRSTSKEEIGHHKKRKQIWVLTDLGLSLSQLETM